MTYTVRAFFKHAHGPDPVILSSADDVDALVDAVLAEEFGNSVAALYVAERPKTERGMPDHELRAAFNSEAGVGGLRYAGTHNDVAGVWYASGKPSERDEVFYYYMGHDEGWPKDSEVPIEDVRAAINEFFESGGNRPATAEWKAWPEAVA
ncbi:MAG: hypothetical protein QOG10_1779 [Kribbellaceae bacterium]|jgi:hypothetical protein|nr:hypothetical protein [Kribbellaceae bacterium]